ncbi:hypothetical protein ACFRI7_06030 [Streptomyces sp. NPDC056716]|uniref:hypothetical protein n=1 Tax=unclassified Streptomyces TaxID=2593676 RepID=UPI00369BC1E7
MKSGTWPEPGESRMTIETYRVRPDGERVDRSPVRTYRAAPGPLPLDSLRLPPCRCPHCRTGDGPPGEMSEAAAGWEG